MFRYRFFYTMALAAALLFYLFFTGYLSFFLLALLLLLPVVSFLLTVLAVCKTEVHMETGTPFVLKNDVFPLRITMKNESILPIAQAELRFTCENSLCGEKHKETLSLPVGTGPKRTVEYQLSSQYCGKITTELSALIFYDYLGIFRIKRKPAISAVCYAAPLAMLPDAQFDDRSDHSGLESSTYSKIKPGDDPSELFQIRTYREGDRLRSIHWKLSTRLDELMVKEFSLPTDSRVLVLAELMAADMDALDTVVETLASVSAFLLDREIVHSIGWYGESGYSETRIETGNDQAAVFHALLGARSYHSKPYSFLSAVENSMEKYPHVIYITGMLTDELTRFRSEPENNVELKILYCGKMDEPQKAMAGKLDNSKTELLEIPVGTTQAGLSGFTL